MLSDLQPLDDVANTVYVFTFVVDITDPLPEFPFWSAQIISHGIEVLIEILPVMFEQLMGSMTA